MADWISVKEAAKIKGCTTANIGYYIKQGKVEARKEKGRWWINPESLETEKDYSKPFESFEILETLKAQLEAKDKQIASLQERLAGSENGRERADTIILALTQQNQQLLEDKRPWYQRWFKKQESNEGR